MSPLFLPLRFPFYFCLLHVTSTIYVFAFYSSFTFQLNKNEKVLVHFSLQLHAHITVGYNEDPISTQREYDEKHKKFALANRSFMRIQCVV